MPALADFVSHDADDNPQSRGRLLCFFSEKWGGKNVLRRMITCSVPAGIQRVFSSTLSR
jgi:hypothetical protein